jgi:plasmid stabilization system protein ParE
MLPYELTALAQEDLKDIARYTLTQWSEKQSLHYADLLEKRFCEIAARTAYSRPLSNRYPQVLVNRCEHHFIFYTFRTSNFGTSAPSPSGRGLG